MLYFEKESFLNREFKKAKGYDKNATKTWDYTTIANTLRTVIQTSDSHPTGVVKPVYRIPMYLFG